jgi:hypothetical protein
VESEPRKDEDAQLADLIESARTAIQDLKKVTTEIDGNALPIVARRSSNLRIDIFQE